MLETIDKTFGEIMTNEYFHIIDEEENAIHFKKVGHTYAKKLGGDYQKFYPGDKVKIMKDSKFKINF